MERIKKVRFTLFGTQDLTQKHYPLTVVCLWSISVEMARITRRTEVVVGEEFAVVKNSRIISREFEDGIRIIISTHLEPISPAELIVATLLEQSSTWLLKIDRVTSSSSSEYIYADIYLLLCQETNSCAHSHHQQV